MFSASEVLISEIKSGKMVILLDDEDRENEGDLIMAASHVSAETMNFFIQHTSGIICLVMDEQYRKELDLPLMVAPEKNTAHFGLQFTISVEAKYNVSTGVSAADRAQTVQAFIEPNAKQNLVYPGHMFPLVAKAGGVLTRPGHTEASYDLVRLAGFEPKVAILGEVMNADGTMSRYPSLVEFSKQHNIKLGTVKDLVDYISSNKV